MKKSRTLQHIAAVAVVLLTLSLVFAAPVSADYFVNSDHPENHHATLQYAVNNVTVGQEYAVTITAVDEDRDNKVTGDGVKVPENVKIIFDFNQLTYNITGTLVGSSNTETNGFQILQKSDVTLKNGTVEISPYASYQGSAPAILIQNYANLTLQDVRLDGSNLSHSSSKYTLSNNYGNIVITGNTVIIAHSDGIAFDLWYRLSDTYKTGVSVTFDENFSGLVDGNIEYGANNAADDGQYWYSLTSLWIYGDGKFTGDIVESSADGLKLGDNFGILANIYVNGGQFKDDTFKSFVHDNYVIVAATDVEYTYGVEKKSYWIETDTFEIPNFEEGSAPQPVTVTVRATGNQAANVTGISFDPENVLTNSDLPGKIEVGQSGTFTLTPLSTLSPGDYSVKITLTTEEDVTHVIDAVSFTVTEKQGGEAGDEGEGLITVTPTSINLGEVVIGSKDTYKEVKITNNGASTISLEIGEDADVPKYGVGGSDGWTSIEAGKTITLKIYANEELPAGTYSAVMKISCNNNVLSTVAITYTLVEDTTSPDGSVEEIKPEFDDTVKTEDGKEVIITVDEETTEVKGNVVTVKDEENGVTMTVTFTSAPTSGEDESTVTGTVAKVKVTYEEKAAEVGTSSEGDVDYSMVLDLTKAGITLPTLNPEFNPTKADYIKETPGLSGHTPLAMITATETSEVNADMKANSGNQVAFTFKISKSLLNGKSMKHLVGYHIADDGKVTKIVPNSGDRKEENNYISVTIYGDKFSTYAVGISDKEEVTTQSGGKPVGGGGYIGSGSTTVKPDTPTVVPPTEEPTDDPADVPEEPVPETPVTPEQPETPATPAPILAVLAGLGAAVVLRRK